MVLCWIFEMQGCPGVEAEQGASINIERPGNRGIGSTGAKRDAVDNRNIITIPDYQIRKIQRFFGLGGTRINISHDVGNVECDGNSSDALPGLESSVLRVDLKTCLGALESDLLNYPRGIELNIVQCQEYFCQTPFIEKFSSFVEKSDRFDISNVELFLKCANPSVLL
jgi:hypothetical protein